MDVLREIFWAYNEGKLTVKPPTMDKTEFDDITSVEKEYGMTIKQASEFENTILAICSKFEEDNFYAGFKLALRMIME